MMLKKLLTLLVLSAVALTLLVPAYAGTTGSTTYAKIVPAVALGWPYNYTVSIQGTNLIVSGISPAYSTNAVKIALIEPVSYDNSSVDADGRATVTLDPTKSLTDIRNVTKLNPTVVKYVNYTLNSAYAEIAPTKMVNSDLTLDYSTVPKIDLSALPDGIYNVWTGYLGTAAYNYLYCDDILVVIKGGKASLQLLPTYKRYVVYEGAGSTYAGYSLAKRDVRPYTTIEAFELWQK